MAIKIDNSSWVEPLVNNTRHIGEGVQSALYTFELLLSIKELIDPFLEKKYNCFKDQLENESERRSESSGGTGGGEASLGTPVGPGVIGDNKTGSDPGYAEDSNLFVGVPDPDAVELAEAINALKAQRTKEIEDIIIDACD